MNRAIGLGCQRPATEEDVSAIGQFFLATGSPRSVITVVPGMLASESSRWLTDAGYRSASVWAKCVHDMASTPPPSSTFRIERVSARDASRYMEVVLEAFEMVGLTAVGHLVASAIDAPGWSHYLGYDGETAVATGALRVEADIAWIGIGATIPAARGRGWQTALLKRRLHDAKVAGCRIAVAETDAETQEHPVNHSYRNMMRTGFRLAYERPNWVRRRQE
jgi:GNAT superfamily N-acetyltransferase